MNFKEYALSKKDSYAKLGWDVKEETENDIQVSFFTKDPSGLVRRHYFAQNDLCVEVMPDGSVFGDAQPLVVEVQQEQVEEQVEEQKKKPKTRKKKGE
jgi:hypothetical protein